MNINDFKKQSKMTYVYIEGALPDDKDFKSYVAVPFHYDDFKSFSESQQKAICQAEILKGGIYIEPKIFLKIDEFYLTDDEVKFREILNDFERCLEKPVWSFDGEKYEQTKNQLIELMESNNKIAIDFLDYFEKAVKVQKNWDLFSNKDIIDKIKEILKNQPHWQKLKKIYNEQYNIDIK